MIFGWLVSEVGDPPHPLTPAPFSGGFKHPVVTMLCDDRYSPLHGLIAFISQALINREVIKFKKKSIKGQRWRAGVDEEGRGREGLRRASLWTCSPALHQCIVVSSCGEGGVQVSAGAPCPPPPLHLLPPNPRLRVLGGGGFGFGLRVFLAVLEHGRVAGGLGRFPGRALLGHVVQGGLSVHGHWGEREGRRWLRRAAINEMVE